MLFIKWLIQLCTPAQTFFVQPHFRNFCFVPSWCQVFEEVYWTDVNLCRYLWTDPDFTFFLATYRCNLFDRLSRKTKSLFCLLWPTQDSLPHSKILGVVHKWRQYFKARQEFWGCSCMTSWSKREGVKVLGFSESRAQSYKTFRRLFRRLAPLTWLS